MELQTPTLATKHVLLRPVVSEDHPFLYHLATSPETGYRWRFGGYVPSVSAFEATLWDSIHVQFVVVGRQSSERIGHVTAYSASHTMGHVYIGVVMRPDKRTGLGIEATGLLIDYLFATWNFRKLYIEVASFNMDQFASILDRFAVEEGVRRDHLWYNGQFWDQHILAVFRDPMWARIRDMLTKATKP